MTRQPEDAFFRREQLDLMVWALEHSQEYMNAHQLELMVQTLDTFFQMFGVEEAREQISHWGSDWQTNAVAEDEVEE